MARVSFLEAIRRAQFTEMQRDARVFIMGEDLTCNVFGSATGLLETFGPARVRDTPICEGGFIGAAAGASMVGMRPIVDATISSFLYPAMDQICSIIAKSRYIYGGQASLPLVVRSCMFYGNSNAAQHSDRPYPMLMGMPGLVVIVPSGPRDVYGLLKSAIRDENPVFCFEDATLWGQKEEVPDDPEFLIPIGKADIKKPGEDVTVIAIGGTLPLAMGAAHDLESEDVSVEVIDPRTLVPLDREAILNSVRKTGRLVIADPANRTCSAASEIAALVAEDAFDSLRAPIIRVTTPDTHVPFSMAIEKRLYPSKDRIVAAIRKTLHGSSKTRAPRPKDMLACQ
jgi:acetoin:2,6-dichlorophenolindophenol oxidoreductase subunit beta